MKNCTKCNVMKSLDNFYNFGKYPSCKQCHRVIALKNYNENVEHRAKVAAQWRGNNPQYAAQYYEINKATIKARTKENTNKRRKIDMGFKIECNLRTRLYNAIKGNYKSGSAIRDLGCSIEALKQYFESLFQPGMSWQNYGQWHIDHIKPLSSFDLTNPNDFKKACHYSNLQPLWANENLKKGARLAA